MKDKLPNRWLLAGAGVLMQVALGAVYAWSVFRDPLIKAGGWSISEVTFTFSIAILILGFAAFLGGLLDEPGRTAGRGYYGRLLLWLGS
jgi:MFS transporter, OFA family, oxalate/formate antiporter